MPRKVYEILTLTYILNILLLVKLCTFCLHVGCHCWLPVSLTACDVTCVLTWASCKLVAYNQPGNKYELADAIRVC